MIETYIQFSRRIEQLNFFDALDSLWSLKFGGCFNFFDCFETGDRFIAGVDEADFFIIIILCVFTPAEKSHYSSFGGRTRYSFKVYHEPRVYFMHR